VTDKFIILVVLDIHHLGTVFEVLTASELENEGKHNIMMEKNVVSSIKFRLGIRGL